MITTIYTWTIALTSILITGLHRTYNFTDFKKYIAKSYRIPNSIKEDCNWNYLVVVMKTDEKSHIKSFSVLNDVSNEFKNSLDIIRKYNFPSKENMNNKNIIFCISVDNHKENCVIVKNKNYSPSEVLKSVLFYYEDEVKKNPKSIIIQEPIILPVYDSIN